MLPRHKGRPLWQAKIGQTRWMGSQRRNLTTTGARGNLAGSDWVECRPALASTVYINDGKRGKTVERFVRQIGWHCRLLPRYQTQHNEKKENDDSDGNKERRPSLCVHVCVVCAATLPRVSLTHSLAHSLTDGSTLSTPQCNT